MHQIASNFDAISPYETILICCDRGVFSFEISNYKLLSELEKVFENSSFQSQQLETFYYCYFFSYFFLSLVFRLGKKIW